MSVSLPLFPGAVLTDHGLSYAAAALAATPGGLVGPEPSGHGVWAWHVVLTLWMECVEQTPVDAVSESRLSELLAHLDLLGQADDDSAQLVHLAGYYATLECLLAHGVAPEVRRTLESVSSGLPLWVGVLASAPEYAPQR